MDQLLQELKGARGVLLVVDYTEKIQGDPDCFMNFSEDAEGINDASRVLSLQKCLMRVAMAITDQIIEDLSKAAK
jgi:hypothetical protein